ncbi:MAG: adenylate/guanylate cyclase domain-containing protein [Candidatus Cloacimonadales bacterium]|jgi:class 3 adenylate cyclase|nr:adenylate/guanylate cyclase domain-containing protein [Candidatus Cloacimonadales bacterium]
MNKLKNTLIILLLFFSLYPLRIWAVHANYEDFVNSLSQYKAQVQVQKIVSYAREIATQDSVNFFNLLDLLNEKKQDIKGVDIELQQLSLYADYLIKKKYFNRTEVEINKIKALLNQSQNHSVLSMAYEVMADNLNYTNKKNEALSLYLEALEQAKKTNNKELLISQYSKISIVNLDLGSYDKALIYSKQALKVSLELKKYEDTIQAYSVAGNIYMQMNQFDSSIENHFLALSIAEQANNEIWISSCYNNIGAVYFSMQDYDMALNYYHKALDIKETVNGYNNFESRLASSYNNVAIIYKKRKDYQQALKYYLKSLELKKIANDVLSSASTHNNIALVYISLEEFSQAKKHLDEAYSIYEHYDNKMGLASSLVNYANYYRIQKDYDKAIEYSLHADGVIKNTSNYRQALINYGLIVKIFEEKGDFEQAYKYHKVYFDYKDSLYNLERSNKISEIQTKYETEKKESENKLLRKDKQISDLKLLRNKYLRNFLIICLFFAVFIALFIMILYNQQRKTNRIINGEKDKSEKLLLNILPFEVAKELKERGSTKPQSFDNVTVMLSDLVNFTQITSELEPEIVIEELNEIFTMFDYFIGKYECERIKTIGDAYLAVCGLPEENDNHARNVVNAALEIVNFIQERNKVSDIQWSIRIGVHTGKVVGGIIGIKKYIYDIFGDTINTASRIENNCLPMQVSVSETTYNIVKDDFCFEKNKGVEIKGKGYVDIYKICGTNKQDLQNTQYKEIG